MAESVTLEEIKIKYTVPRDFEEESRRPTGATYKHKKKNWSFGISSHPAGEMGTPKSWCDSAVGRAKKEGYKVTLIKVPGAEGAYIAQHKDSSKSPFWGRVGIHAKSFTYDLTFMCDPEDIQKSTQMVHNFAKSIKILP